MGRVCGQCIVGRMHALSLRTIQVWKCVGCERRLCGQHVNRQVHICATCRALTTDVQVPCSVTQGCQWCASGVRGTGSPRGQRECSLRA